MTNHRNSFIKDLFDLLQQEDYLLLKWWGQELASLPESTDLDILVRPQSIQKVEAFIKASITISGVQQAKHIGVHHYFLFFKDGGFLQIDFLTQFIRKNIVYIKTEEAFASTRILDGIKTYSLEKLFEHVVLFNFLNYSGLPNKYCSLFSSLPLPQIENLLQKFNQKFKTNFKSITDTHYKINTRKKLKNYLLEYKENRLVNRILHGFKFVNFSWRSLKVNNGEIITFSGVDGAGKSTILQDTLHLLEGKFRKQVVVLRHRPSLLPILSAWKYGKEAAEEKSISRLPRQGNNTSTFSSLVRFGYYYFDYLLGQIYVWAKYILRGKVVLYDRYYYDFIIDGKRSNISLPATLPKSLFTFLQKPTLNFFLYADAQTILERKKELPAKDIEALTQGYKTLFQEFTKKHSGHYIPIENIDRKATLSIIENYFIQQMVG